MANVELVIKIPEETYKNIQSHDWKNGGRWYSEEWRAIHNGALLPKGHGRLKDENYLLSILRCEEYETCTWRNCSDCNREKCIKRCTLLDAPTIIEADKVESEE